MGGCEKDRITIRPTDETSRTNSIFLVDVFTLFHLTEGGSDGAKKIE